MAQTFQDIEKAAEYTPSVGANILNLLTGGIYGGVTGKTRQAQEAERLRQMLRQETFSERGEERALDRQMRRALIGQMLTEGVQLEPGQQPEKMNVFDMAQMLRSQQAKNAVLAEAGTRTGFGYSDVPTQEQAASPAFQTAAAKAASEMYGMRARTLAEEEMSRPRIIAQLNALDVKFDPATPTAGLDALLSRKKAVLSQEQSSQYSYDRQADIAREWLNRYNASAPEDQKIATEGLNNAQVIAAKSTAERMIEQNKETAAEKNAKAIEKRYKDILDAYNSGDADKAKYLFDTSPYSAVRMDNRMQDILRVKQPISKNTALRKTLDELPGQMMDALGFIKKVSEFSGSKNLAEISAENFATLKAKLDKAGSAYFGNDKQREAVRSIVQEFEGIVSKERKTLFGASLTNSELASALDLFGNKESAEFLPRAIQFMDKIFRNKPSQRWGMYSGMGVYDDAVDPIINAYKTERSKINWAPFEELITENAPVQVAPASPAPQPTRPDGTNAISQQLQLIGNRINELKSRNSTNIVNPLNK